MPDYFDELLERIRDIRASEKRMYLKVRDIFALAADYRPDDAETLKFFQIIQNKLHGPPPARPPPNSSLSARRPQTTQHGAYLLEGRQGTQDRRYRRQELPARRRNPGTQPHRHHVPRLRRDQARRRQVLYMRDWREKLDAFLRSNERDILTNAGKVAKEVADKLRWTTTKNSPPVD